LTRSKNLGNCHRLAACRNA